MDLDVQSNMDFKKHTELRINKANYSKSQSSLYYLELD